MNDLNLMFCVTQFSTFFATDCRTSNYEKSSQPIKAEGEGSKNHDYHVQEFTSVINDTIIGSLS